MRERGVSITWVAVGFDDSSSADSCIIVKQPCRPDKVSDGKQEFASLLFFGPIFIQKTLPYIRYIHC